MVKTINPSILGGFRDYNQKETIIRNSLIDKIRRIYESFGFEPIETPSLERTDILLGKKGVSDMIIFKTQLLSGGRIVEKDAGSLRFDLTVPLARFIASKKEVVKPLKIYQIGRVWRGERQQKGRFKEFLQIDADVLGSSSMLADSEIIFLIYKVLSSLNIGNFIIKINNRKILNQLSQYAGFDNNKNDKVLKILDKILKIGDKKIKSELAKLKLGDKSIKKIFDFIKIKGNNKEKLSKAELLFQGIKEAEQGIKELEEIIDNLESLNLKNYEIDFSIIRGLDYYTGPIFETYLKNREEIGSIMSGGRYDDLLRKFSDRKMPATGVSLGFDRLYSIINELAINKEFTPSVEVLILWLDEIFKNEYLKIVSSLRDNGIKAEIYFGDDKAFNAQLNYAIKKEIPFVLLLGEREAKENIIQLRDMCLKKQWPLKKENLIDEIRKIIKQK